MNPSLIALLTIIAGVALYFMPTIIACSRDKAGRAGVVFLNLLLGWTLIGWIVAFVWACTGPTEKEARAKEVHDAELLDMLKQLKQVHSEDLNMLQARARAIAGVPRPGREP